MAIVHWYEKEELIDAAIATVQPVEVVLDIGCGIMPQNYIKPLTHICCEPFIEYVSHLQQKLAALEQRDRTYVVLNMGWNDAVRYFPPKSVDTVFLVDVVEHLEKEEGCKLLALTEAIARKQVVIFTPLGFMPQHHDGKDAWGLNGADWQEHKSGWLPEDFGDGWQVFAAKKFHVVDSLSRPLETPYGALWAIKTHPSTENGGMLTRENILTNIEVELRRKQSKLDQWEIEMHSLILARIERKLRRVFMACFASRR
jgi:hypothetical protein